MTRRYDAQSPPAKIFTFGSRGTMRARQGLLSGMREERGMISVIKPWSYPSFHTSAARMFYP